MSRFLRRPAAEERGASALEFGLVAPVLFMLVFGLVQYGYQFWSLTTASATAREAARRMSVGHDWVTCTVPRAVDHASHPAVGEQDVEVRYRLVDDDGAVLTRPAQVGDLVEVTVAFQSLHIGLPFLPVPDDGWVEQTVAARVESVPALPLDCAGPGNP